MDLQYTLHLVVLTLDPSFLYNSGLQGDHQILSLIAYVIKGSEGDWSRSNSSMSIKGNILDLANHKK